MTTPEPARAGTGPAQDPDQPRAQSPRTDEAEAGAAFYNHDALVEFVRAVRDSGYRFTSVSPATHARVNARPENAVATDLRGVLGWSRPFAAEAVPPAILALMREAGVLQAHPAGWRSLVRCSSLGDNLILHSAYPTDTPDAVFFGPDTYRFALAIQEHLAHRQAPVRRAVDIGCGAGPGAIVVARACPQAQVWAGDINTLALRLAAVNVQVAGTGNVTPCHSNLLGGVPGEFDLIVANPPYLNDPGERAYRHGGGPLGAQLSVDIVRAALGRLAPGGTLLLYTGVAIVDGADPFRAEVDGLLRGSGFEWRYVETDPDVFGEELDNPAYAHADRIAVVVLTATRPA